MTIASQTSRISYTGNSSTTAFAIPFYFAANADIVVYLKTTAGVSTLQTLGTDYTLTGATLAAGGTCTFVTAPTTGYTVTIYRDPAVTQTTSYNANDPFPAKAHELALDKATTIDQRTRDLVTRALHLPDSETAITTELATAELRANKLLAFDSTGALSYALSPTFVSATSTGVAIVDSLATAQVTTFAVSVNIIVTKGKTVPGDSGGGTYKRGSGTGQFTDGGSVTWIPTSDKDNVGAVTVSTSTVAATLTYPTSVILLTTGGTTTVGDGGAATYKRGTGVGSFTDAGAITWVPFTGGNAGVTSASGPIAFVAAPQLRLTLTSATPVMTTSVSAQTTVYYTPYAGQQVPIYNGTSYVTYSTAELSQATTDTTKSPAACTTNSNYDMFVWVDSGTVRLSRGPAWTSDTSRGTGTALTLVNGIYLNNASITNGPAASRGTYVGTIRTNGTSTVDYIFGSIGAGGVAANFGVWNAFNRVPVTTAVLSNTNSWTYAVSGVWRAPNASTTFRVSAVRGLDEDGIDVSYHANVGVAAGATAVCGIGLNSLTAYVGTTATSLQVALNSLVARYSGTLGLGYNFVSAIEYNDTTNVSTWRGLVTSFPIQAGLHARLSQ